MLSFVKIARGIENVKILAENTLGGDPMKASSLTGRRHDTADRSQVLFHIDLPDVSEFSGLIAASGHTRWPLQLNSTNFPMHWPPFRQFACQLVMPEGEMSSLEMVEFIARMGNDRWRLGRLEHLLALAARFPEAQLKCPIVALGSIAPIEGRICSPMLSSFGGNRIIDLLPFTPRAWLPGRAFLLVSMG